MSKAKCSNSGPKPIVPSPTEVVAQIHPLTGRLIDPRVVAWGQADLAMCAARDDLAAALRGLGVDPDPMMSVLLTAHCRAGAMIEKALTRTRGQRAA